MKNALKNWIAWLVCMTASLSATASFAVDASPGETFRLFEGVTAYVNNPEGKDFAVSLDVRDINLLANGPREVMFKVYDPEGRPVVREFIPDDGCATANMEDRVGGWDHQLQCFVDQFTKGSVPWVRWSAWSDPGRLSNIVKRTFDRQIKGGKKGVYRIVLAGCPDHYVTLRVSEGLKYGVAGHPSWQYGHGEQWRRSFVYVPKGTVGLQFAVCEPDMPRGRRFKLTAPDGKVLFDGGATGGYVGPTGDEWKATTSGFAGGGYDGQLLTLEVSPGQNDFMVRVNLIQAGKGSFADYGGMATCGVFCADEATATAIANGTFLVDGDIFWHPVQARFQAWLKANKLDGDDKQKELRKSLEAIYGNMRLLETSDGRGCGGWPNWAYAMGYYGCDLFRPSWVMVRQPDCPPEVKEILKEALVIAGDRLSTAAGIEKVNGNAFSQINVALWYAKSATGDKLLGERFEIFWQRWTTQGWGKGSGLSPSGDSQEHFGHDMLYGSYIMNNWMPTKNTWVKGGGILGDATDDPRFQKVMDRYYELYSYLLCREVGTEKAQGGRVAACPWSARTNGGSSNSTIAFYDNPDRPWKGDPGPDFNADVNDGHEWFAARRKDYYLLTFHGRLAPEWLCQAFEGQIGFGGGVICQLTVPGRGPVLASTLNDQYGKGMHPTNWENYHIHSIVGERWDGVPVISGISEHDDAKIDGDTVTSSGEIRGAHIRVSRSYTYKPDAIECSVQLAKSEHAQVMFLWGHEGRWSEMRLAYEMIPYMGKWLDRRTPTKVTADDGAVMTTEAVMTKFVRIDRGGFGVEVRFEKPMACKLGKNDTLLVEIVAPAPKPTPAERVALKYTLAPFNVPPPAETEKPAATKPASKATPPAKDKK